MARREGWFFKDGENYFSVYHPGRRVTPRLKRAHEFRVMFQLLSKGWSVSQIEMALVRLIRESFDAGMLKKEKELRGEG